MKALMSLILTLIAITLIMGCSGGKGSPVIPQEPDQKTTPVDVSGDPMTSDDLDLGGNVEDLSERRVTAYADGFNFPVSDSFPPTTPNGWNASALHFNQYNSDPNIKEWHYGEDWNKNNTTTGDAGKPVYAVASGILKYKSQGAAWLGEYLIIEHTLPGNIIVNTLYGHLENMTTRSVGSLISKNDVVGKIYTNNPNGPHLHFEIRWGASNGSDCYGPELGRGVLGPICKQFDPTDFIGNNQSFNSNDGGIVIFNDKFDPGQWHWGTNISANKWYKTGPNGYEFGGPGFWYVSSGYGNPSPCLRFGVNDSTNYGNNEGGSGHTQGPGQTWGDIAETYPIWVPAETTNLKLVFDELHLTEANYDFCSVDIVYNSESGTPYYAYNVLEYSGDSSGWNARSITLDPSRTNGRYCRLRFRFRSDGSQCNRTGWMIDNIKLIANYTSSGSIPSAPTNVQASDGTYTDRILVSWTGSSGATKYNIYRASSQYGTYSYMTYTSSTSYSDYVTNTSTYWYKVSAANNYGESSQAGPNSGYKGTSGSPPSPPTNVQASDGSYSLYILLSWSSSSGATQYYVYRATSQYGTYSFYSSTTLNYFNDYVSDTNTYWYKVSARNSYGESGLAGPDSGYKWHGYEILWSDSITSSSWSYWYAYNYSGSAYWYIEDVGSGGSGTKSFRCGIPGGNYGNNENDDIYSMSVVIPPNSRNVCLSFYSRWRVEYNFDFCEVWFSNNGTWTLLDKYGDESSNESGVSKNYYNPDWQYMSYGLPSTYSQSATYQLKFHFTSDGSQVEKGWQIDQVTLSRG